MTQFFERVFDLNPLLSRRSAFLFGPRGCGKSTLIKQTMPAAPLYNLLDEKTYLKLLKDSSIIDQENRNPGQLIVIDEVQKLPKILDEVHRLIFEKKHRFLLTGSSARKLKHGGANLLGGRASELHLFPLVSKEIPQFDLLSYLNRGGLPAIFQSPDPIDDLKSYVSLYLREEIAAEALTRRVDFFSRFLDVIALNNGEELHYENLSNDSGVPAKTIKNYIEILEDTLIGFQILPFSKTKKRKAITRSKFFLFDLGVTRVLSKRSEIEAQSELFGRAFEHFIFLETRAAIRYLKSDLALEYWRSQSNFEVDLIYGDSAFEIKSTSHIDQRHIKGLRALMEEKKLKRYFLICNVDKPRAYEGIEIIPWMDYLEQLWMGKYF